MLVNRNSAAIYIPVGPENEITGGSHNNVNQPELFLPGGGSLTVPYDGNQITWQVTSNKNNGSKGAIPANSSNTQCNKSAEADALEEATGEDGKGITLYPNPSSGKVYIQLNGLMIEGKDINVFDVYGKSHHLGLIQSSDYQVEIDLTGLSAGLYLVRIDTGDNIEVFRVLKK